MRASQNRRGKDISSPQIPEQTTFSSLAHSANIFYFTYDPKLRYVTTCSDNVKAVLGTRDADIVREGNLFLRHVHPKDRFIILTKLEDALAGISPYQATYRWIRPDTNETRWVHCRGTLKQNEQGPLFEGMIFELAQAQNNSSDLTKSLELLDSVFIILDSDFSVIYQNGKAESSGFNFGDAAFNFQKLNIGHHIEQAFSSHASWSPIRDLLKNSFEHDKLKWKPFHCNDRSFQIESSLIVDESNEPILILHVQDISELLNAKVGMQMLSKATSYQVVAHGVMHTINNSLQALITEIANLIDARSRPNEVKDRGEKLMKIAHRTASLTHELLALGGEASSVIDLNICVMNAIGKSREYLPLGTELEIAFATTSLCYGSTPQITQLIENMLQVVWGEIPVTKTSLRTTIAHDGTNEKMLVEVDCQYHHSSLVHEEDLKQALNRLQMLSPHIAVFREQNKLRLMLSFDKAPDADSVMEISAATNPLVLVVDDEPLVGDTICALLKHDDINATHVTSARKALQLLRTHKSIQVVITDAVMPDIRGSDFIRRIKRQLPGMHVIGFSGSPSELKPMKDSGANEVLLKPVDPVVLRNILAKYLDLQENSTKEVGNL